MMYFGFMALAQILLESLPISSSGHLRIFEAFALYKASSWLRITQEWEYFFHGPTIIVIACYFFNAWWPMVRYPYRYRFVIMHFMQVGFLAESMTILFYIFFSYEGICWFPLSLGFLVTTVILLTLLWVPQQKSSMTPLKAVVIGAVQGLALLPGISRLGITYAVGCWLGLSPQRSFAFSCALQWPLIVMGFLKGCISLSHQPIIVWLINYKLIVAITLASIGAYFLLWYCEYQARTQKFWLFGVYMIIPFIVSLWLC